MQKPTWLETANIKTTLDARPVLASGEHPIERVIRETAALNPGEIFEILTPFPPMPMIEKLSVLGFKSHSEKDDSGLYHTYFIKS